MNKWLRILPQLLLLPVAAFALIHYALSNAKAERLAQYGDFLAPTQPDRAYIYSQDALAAWPTLADAMILSAQLEYRRGNGQLAVSQLEEAIALADSPGIPMRLLGSLLVNNPETVDQGIEWMLRGLRLAPPSEQEARLGWVQLGQAAIDARQYGLAIWALNRAEMFGYDDPSLERLLPWAYESLNMRLGARSR